MKNYYQNLTIDSNAFKLDLQKDTFNFLQTQQCSVLSENLIKQYANQVVDSIETYVQALLASEKQIEGELEERIRLLIRMELNSLKKIISQCFPDYIWPENMEDMAVKMENFQLNHIKNFKQNLILSRDQKMVKKMLPYFEQGGAFAAVGFTHLKGIIEEFKAQGYKVRFVKFSKPLKEANTNKENNSD